MGSGDEGRRHPRPPDRGGPGCQFGAHPSLLFVAPAGRVYTPSPAHQCGSWVLVPRLKCPLVLVISRPDAKSVLCSVRSLLHICSLSGHHETCSSSRPLSAAASTRKNTSWMTSSWWTMRMRIYGRFSTFPNRHVSPAFSDPGSPIPQLEFGHLQLQDWRNQLERNHPGLYVCGFGWEGIGINDMTKKAKEVAVAVAAGGTPMPGKAAPKPVYF